MSRCANNNIHVSDLKTYEGKGNNNGRDLKQALLVVLESPLFLYFIHNLVSMDFIFIICDYLSHYIWRKVRQFQLSKVHKEIFCAKCHVRSSLFCSVTYIALFSF